MKSTSRGCRLVRMPARSPGFSMHRPGRGADRHAQLVGDDVGERRLAEAGRAVEQHVVERLAALARRRDRHVQVLADAVLADVVVERPRPQPGLVLRVVVDARRRRQSRSIGSSRHAPRQRPCSAPLAARASKRGARSSRVAAPRRRAFSAARPMIARGSPAPRAGRRAASSAAAGAAPAPRPIAPAAAGPAARARCARRSSCRRRESPSAAPRRRAGSAPTRSRGSMPDSTASASFGPMPLTRDQPLEQLAARASVAKP